MVQAVSLEYYVPVRKEKRGRPRKNKSRGKAGTGCFPLAVQLGVIAHASPSLAEEVVLECLKDSYAEATVALARKGISMSWTRVQRIVNSVGARGIERREHSILNVERNAIARGKRLAVTLDGGRVLTRKVKGGKRLESGRHGYDAEWHEPKLFLIYELDEKGRKARKGFQRCGGTMEGPDKLIELLVAELKAIGADEAECVAFLGDGAKWIWNRIDQIAEEAGIGRERIRTCLDYYHAVEHLSVIAQAYPFGSAKGQQKWLRRMKKLLLETTPDAFIGELCKYRRKRSSTIRREIQYFKTNRSAIGYAATRGEKLPIGSGSIESAVRRVVNLRIKGAGIFWKMENVEQFMHMRCQLKTGNWGRFFNELLYANAN